MGVSAVNGGTTTFAHPHTANSKSWHTPQSGPPLHKISYFFQEPSLGVTNNFHSTWRLNSLPCACALESESASTVAGRCVTMADVAPQLKDRADQLYFRAQQNAPLNRRQVLGLVTILVAVGTVLTLAGLAFAGTSITFLLASPILLLFSPILVPLAVIAFFSVGSLLGFGGFVSFVVWVWKYYKGGHPVGSDQVDAARYRLYEGANQVKNKAQQYSQEAKEYVKAKTDTAGAA